jgi:4-carboxymuconolactone decarboxylase
MNARLPYVVPDQAPDQVRDALVAMPPLNIFRMLAHAETAFAPVVRFGGAILTKLALDPMLRELAVLQVAIDCDCEYEWVQHAAVGQHVGLSAEQVGAVKDGRIDDPVLFDELQRAVLQFTREVVAGPEVSDETFAAVNDRVTPREVVELLLAIGNYLMIARLMTTLRLDVDPPAGMDVANATGALLDSPAR